MKKITTIEMEIILSSYFNVRRNLIVPNVSWGMCIDQKPLHECDLLICTKSNYLHEIEIKVSKSDLKADKKKFHHHFHPAIKSLYFAYPETLKNVEEYVPERAGIITVGRTETGILFTKILRKPKNNMKSRAITDKEKFHLAHLGSMRIWTLKKRILQNRNN